MTTDSGSSAAPDNTNTDPSEIAKFDALAHRWWDRTGEMRALHDINPLRANYIDLKAQVAGKTLLDVGCGGGILSEGMSQRGASVTGIDMGTEPLNVARMHLYESKLEIDYQQSTAEAFADKHAGQFDIVCCMEMLEHVPEPASVIDACARLCKPGGELFFSTINRSAKSYLMAILGAEYVLKLVPKGTHHYEKLIRPSELNAWLRNADLLLNDMAGIEYNPLTKQYRISDNTDVNYMVHVTKPL
ncbi:Ubiquinone biosynthesis O-methyltransferase [BD1-7 clade bacterium]|uniref:Ubiquinone biosynthesis O-methyltransferase n=1 Tax=BD1-7 clade bacterium TaxID=2029982 RepID=A0A5S9PTU5_9GAMM|nr:Ubiquinone biosynthesis O-methyltransferase [BD1-7 clade bacterium]CAA0108326.1 Ubiquinone biosynthesis O-methyltransferase [BD1-7 clade bacterium]